MATEIAGEYMLDTKLEFTPKMWKFKMLEKWEYFWQKESSSETFVKGSKTKKFENFPNKTKKYWKFSKKTAENFENFRKKNGWKVLKMKLRINISGVFSGVASDSQIPKTLTHYHSDSHFMIQKNKKCFKI